MNRWVTRRCLVAVKTCGSCARKVFREEVNTKVNAMNEADRLHQCGQTSRPLKAGGEQTHEEGAHQVLCLLAPNSGVPWGPGHQDLRPVPGPSPVLRS